MSGINPLEVLTPDLARHLFGYLDRKEKASASLVCKGWNALINNHPQLIWRQEAERRFQIDRFIFPNISIALPDSSVVMSDEGEKKTLAQLVASVHNAASTAKVLPAVAMDQIADGLVAIVQGEQNVPSAAPFPSLESETTDLAVAGPLYIIREIRNPASPIRDAAILAFRKLAAFYVLHGSEFPAAKRAVLKALNGMAQAYLGSCQDYEVKELISIFRQRLPEVQQITCRMAPSRQKAILFETMALLATKASQPIVWKPCVISNDHRLYCEWRLDENMDDLLRLSRDDEHFAENLIPVILLSKAALMGLSQRPAAQFNELRTPGRGNGDPNRYFGGLADYLNNPDYGYVLANQTAPTSTLRKAAVLFIIQGLESDVAEVRLAALKAVRSLAKDFLQDGHLAVSAEHYRRAIFEIVHGFVDVVGDQAEMCETVTSIFRRNIPCLKAFVKFLPQGEDRAALKAAVKQLMVPLE